MPIAYTDQIECVYIYNAVLRCAAAQPKLSCDEYAMVS